MGRNKISISVAGSEFVVVTDEDRDYTLKLAETLDTKIRALLRGNPKLSVAMAAILCGLDLCDENEKNKESCARLREEIRRYLNQLEAVGTEQKNNREAYQEQLEKLQEENENLRNQLHQYELGQIGFQS